MVYIIAFLCLFILACVLQIGARPWKADFQAPASWHEFIAAFVGALAFLFFVHNCEIAHGASNAGSAVFLVLMIPVLLLGGSSRENWKILIMLSVMLIFSAFRILCIGCAGASITGICALLLVFVLAAACCETPMKREILSRYFFTSIWQALPRGMRNFQHALHLPQFNLFTRVGCAAVLVPVFLVMVFGSIFALANPAIVEWFKGIWEWILSFNEFIRWLAEQHFWRQLFVFLFAFCGLCGFLVPRVWTLDQSSQYSGSGSRQEEEPVTTGHIAMYWNSLFGLIIVFAMNLVYEFSTLLTGKIPAGFDYGWYFDVSALTIAPLVFAGIFRQKVCNHEKIKSLKRLAFVWIVENALLAVTIYIRLGIYVQNSGLTCMRVIGFLGTTALLVGIVWMVQKLRKDYSVDWLLSRYSWTIATFIWIYSVLPVDYIVWKYNVAMFQPKDLLAQIADQRISQEGLLPLFPLLQDSTVGDGVADVIARQKPEFLKDQATEKTPDWRNRYLLQGKLQTLFQKNQEILDKAEKKIEAGKKVKKPGKKDSK